MRGTQSAVTSAGVLRDMRGTQSAVTSAGVLGVMRCTQSAGVLGVMRGTQSAVSSASLLGDMRGTQSAVSSWLRQYSFLVASRSGLCQTESHIEWITGCFTDKTVRGIKPNRSINVYEQHVLPPSSPAWEPQIS